MVSPLNLQTKLGLGRGGGQKNNVRATFHSHESQQLLDLSATYYNMFTHILMLNISNSSTYFKVIRFDSDAIVVGPFVLFCLI